MASSRNSESPEVLPEAVATCLRRNLLQDQTCQTLVVGLSGGRDSVALLHMLHGLQPDFGFQLSACHVNHQLSPHSAEWQSFCQHYCDDLGIHLDTLTVDVPRGTSEGLEAAARTERYAAIGKLSADWLVLGQHRGDQAETLLFNLLRGAGIQGASGMPEMRRVRPGMRLMRPLLGIARQDIEDYLRCKSLHWVDDESNADVRYSRNFLRHQILPMLASRFPAAEENLAAAAQRFGEAQRLLNDLAILDLAGTPADFPLPVSCLAGLDEPHGRNLMRFMLTSRGVQIPSEARLSEILRQVLSARTDRHPAAIFGDWKIFRKRGAVHLEKILGGAPE